MFRVGRMSLAPDQVEPIVPGEEPSGLSLEQLVKGLPLRWADQREWSRATDHHGAALPRNTGADSTETIRPKSLVGARQPICEIVDSLYQSDVESTIYLPDRDQHGNGRTRQDSDNALGVTLE